MEKKRQRQGFLMIVPDAWESMEIDNSLWPHMTRSNGLRLQDGKLRLERGKDFLALRRSLVLAQASHRRIVGTLQPWKLRAGYTGSCHSVFILLFWYINQLPCLTHAPSFGGLFGG